jgi:site-specific recombinase XerC
MKRCARLTMQLTPKGVIGILSNLQDPYLAIAQLMYGAGLRLMEAMVNCSRHSFATHMFLIVGGEGD